MERTFKEEEALVAALERVQMVQSLKMIILIKAMFHICHQTAKYPLLKDKYT